MRKVFQLLPALVSPFLVSIAEANDGVTIELGSPRATVVAVMGTPSGVKSYTALGEEVWSYGYSTITFRGGRVSEWRNSGNLRVFVGDRQPEAAPIRRGSSKEVAVAAMGTPTSIQTYTALGEEVWGYGYSTITFRGGRVSEWRNSGNLRVFAGDRQPEAAPIRRGSSREAVVAAMGTPVGIRTYTALGEEIWSYGYSTITFRGGQVAEWSNAGNLYLTMARGSPDRSSLDMPASPRLPVRGSPQRARTEAPQTPVASSAATRRVGQAARPVATSQQRSSRSSSSSDGLVVAFWIVVIILVVRAVIHSSSRSSSAGSQPRTSGAVPAIPGQTYRPKTTTANPRIVFRADGGSMSAAGVIADLSGLRDAVTGTALDPSRGLYRCGQCEVFYHSESYELVREENAGRCVSCGTAAIVSISHAQAKKQSGRNYEAGITTLADYPSKEGQVVIFEGQCVNVLQSRRGLDYAVMFEKKSWSRGFKLVVFRGATAQLGGPAFLRGLAGKRIRVRGLIVNHPRWGYEIIVNDRAMILGVS